MIDKVNWTLCVGCKACGDICPVEAISYSIDKEGFWYPTIDHEKCVTCNKCEKVCPSLSSKDRYTDNLSYPVVYAGYHTDLNIRMESTSGGIYYAVAKAFLDNGGILVGCEYTSNYLSAVHAIATDIEGLNRLMRSKYFQSDAEGIYKKINYEINKGQKILFCGTPCQVDALYNYVDNTENLYTIDFVCLGVNSPMPYRKFLEELEGKYKSKVKEVHLKNKSQGWQNLGTKIYFANGKEYYANKDTDPWVNAYINGRFYIRDSCGVCRFKSFPRVSDVSIGDFWGPVFNEDDSYRGVSLIMINNNKGKELIRMCKDDVILQKRTLEEALNGNPAIMNSVVISEKKELFFENLDKMPYSKAVWKTLNIQWPKWWIRYKKIRIKDFLKRIKRKIKRLINVKG